MPDATLDQQVIITRVFDAPRARVFKAWTDPDDVAAWYGPEHSDTPRELIRIDLRVGGRYELTMVRRDNGATFALGYEIIELFDHGEKTRMTLTDGPYARGAEHAEAGWNSAFAQLAIVVTAG